jgi:predicted amidophosphoribosyltransferase
MGWPTESIMSAEPGLSWMALTNCPDCGNSVSSEALACPKCGRPAGVAFSGEVWLDALGPGLTRLEMCLSLGRAHSSLLPPDGFDGNAVRVLSDSSFDVLQ